MDQMPRTSIDYFHTIPKHLFKCDRCGSSYLFEICYDNNNHIYGYMVYTNCIHYLKSSKELYSYIQRIIDWKSKRKGK